jgi:hypothetical protein
MYAGNVNLLDANITKKKETEDLLGASFSQTVLIAGSFWFKN